MKGLLLVALATFTLCSAMADGLDDGLAAYQRKDYEQAFEKFKDMAMQGNARAQTNPAELYKRGHGATQSFTEAAYWYKLAVDQGFANAQFSLGALYANGQGVSTNDCFDPFPFMNPDSNRLQVL